MGSQQLEAVIKGIERNQASALKATLNYRQVAVLYRSTASRVLQIADCSGGFQAIGVEAAVTAATAGLASTISKTLKASKTLSKLARGGSNLAKAARAYPDLAAKAIASCVSSASRGADLSSMFVGILGSGAPQLIGNLLTASGLASAAAQQAGVLLSGTAATSAVAEAKRVDYGSMLPWSCRGFPNYMEVELKNAAVGEAEASARAEAWDRIMIAQIRLVVGTRAAYKRALAIEKNAPLMGLMSDARTLLEQRQKLYAEYEATEEKYRPSVYDMPDARYWPETRRLKGEDEELLRKLRKLLDEIDAKFPGFEAETGHLRASSEGVTRLYRRF